MVLTEKQSGSDTAARLCAAINSRLRVEFNYHGGPRLVEPFCCGIIAPGNIEVLDCYQVSGYSELDEPIGWKLFRVSEIAGLEITGEQSGSDRPHPADYPAMTSVYCCASGNAEAARYAGVFPGPPEESESAPPAPEEQYETPFQKHKKLMRIFRFSHRFPFWR